MLVKDFILNNVNIDKQVEIICNNQVDYEKEVKPYNKDKVKEVQIYFINKLSNIEPIIEDSIIIFEKMYDIDDEDIIQESTTCSLYHKKELKNYLTNNSSNIHNKKYEEPIDDTLLTSDELATKVHEIHDFPSSYGFIFTEWEHILGWEVYEGNLDKFDIQECIYSLLYEMSFNGITNESQEERRQELDESIKESEYIQSLPEEEREKHYISMEDMEKHWEEEFGWTPPTQEEKEFTRLQMWRCSLKSAIWRYHNFKSIKL